MIFINIVQVYEKAMNSTSSINIYEAYAQFLKELSGLECTQNKGTDNQIRSPEERYNSTMQLLQLYSRAREASISSPCIAEGHVNVLLNLGKLDTARQLLEELCLREYKQCARIWTMRIVLEMKSETVTEVSGLDRLIVLCETCLKQIPISEAQEIWAMVRSQSSIPYFRSITVYVYNLSYQLQHQNGYLVKMEKGASTYPERHSCQYRFSFWISAV